jgi:hypothetical protein
LDAALDNGSSVAAMIPRPLGRVKPGCAELEVGSSDGAPVFP